MKIVGERRLLWRWALLVWILAVGVRLVAISAVTGWAYRPESVGDAPDYHRLAVNLVEGRGYALPWNGGGPNTGRLEPTAYRAPLWPAVLAVTYEMAGERPWVGRLVNVGLDATTCAMLVFLGAGLAGPLTGVLAGAFAAFYPPLWVNVFQLHSEVLFTLLLVLILLAAHRFSRRRSLVDAVMVGGVAGVAALARPNGLVVVVPLAVWAACAVRAQGRRRPAHRSRRGGWRRRPRCALDDMDGARGPC
ncbi:MAG: glycosyltransferase family 39 protein, partial [Actinobacteria bacterium]|nr:glycosyltransferase family 39 protein [Actinomycetota bacterium]